MQVSRAVVYISHGSYLLSFTCFFFFVFLYQYYFVLAHPAGLFNVGIRAY